MKTIAVDEDTWEAIKKLKVRLEARSYDEVLKKLIQAWHRVELDMKAESVSIDDEEAELILNIIKNMKKGGQGDEEAP
ncbi:hypothetical protein [Thermococcus sp.]|uniref:hypothetical protein n=1 Tax=Thermococcus sp. TaxID=35749 RepID=UPI0026335420|nr:hypothetical protein [Thermococcus sp.]